MRKPVPLYMSVILLSTAIVFGTSSSKAQQPTFRNAPESASQMKNPYTGNTAAAGAGKTTYRKYCSQCHGNNRQGMGPAPALDSEKVRTANSGELFWFITNGKPTSGMPAWPNLTKQQKWQVVTFLQSKPQ